MWGFCILFSSLQLCRILGSKITLQENELNHKEEHRLNVFCLSFIWQCFRCIQIPLFLECPWHMALIIKRDLLSSTYHFHGECVNMKHYPTVRPRYWLFQAEHVLILFSLWSRLMCLPTAKDEHRCTSFFHSPEINFQKKSEQMTCDTMKQFLSFLFPLSALVTTQYFHS